MAYTNGTRLANKAMRIRNSKSKPKPSPIMPKGLLNKPNSNIIKDNTNIALKLKEHIRKGFEDA
tara:strand:+ start:91 stop:282 length:192 start_codon:yes stop_codon:yes gene_type:complete